MHQGPKHHDAAVAYQNTGTKDGPSANIHFPLNSLYNTGIRIKMRRNLPCIAHGFLHKVNQETRRRQREGGELRELPSGTIYMRGYG